MKANVNDYATVLAALQNQPKRNMFADALTLERVRGITIGGVHGDRPWHGPPILSEDLIEQARTTNPDPIAGLVALRNISADCRQNHIGRGEQRMAEDQVSRLGITIVNLIGPSS